MKDIREQTVLMGGYILLQFISEDNFIFDCCTIFLRQFEGGLMKDCA